MTWELIPIYEAMCERRPVCTNTQLSVISILMKGHNVTGI